MENALGTLYPENNARTSKIFTTCTICERYNRTLYTATRRKQCRFRTGATNVAVARFFFHRSVKIRLFLREWWWGGEPKNLPTRRVEIYHTCSSEQQTYFRYSGHALHWFQSKNVFSIFTVTYTSVPYRVSQIPFTDK